MAPVKARLTLLVHDGHFWVVVPRQRLQYIDSNDMARACWRQYSVAPHYKRAASPEIEHAGETVFERTILHCGLYFEFVKSKVKLGKISAVVERKIYPPQPANEVMKWQCVGSAGAMDKEGSSSEAS